MVYDLPAVVELALRHSPAVAGAEGALQQSEGRRVEAGAYPNPSITAAST
jgi:cobalt-zinc-cadmium efflux system outer membrane protein